MAFPANDVERALAEVLEDTATTPGFLATLRSNELVVPLPEGAGVQSDGSVALPVLTHDDASFVPVFTSEEQLAQLDSSLAYTTVPARELAGMLPEGVGLAVNPGATATVPIPAENVWAIAGTPPDSGPSGPDGSGPAPQA
ncbi:SseB family protein [Allonocardiopsis opalescens]|uniref:Type III secretion system (T3SS) SseB-like protein n=1 Tax=Allonocardiopsis opalescens TaxID=1144618 RepID=A0A2T0PUD0_9ACTN|nr:SseB family protein [Allonocardiopsis opalescens]PRX92509.1 type III secretion system (T3SS) SseB-like protein [Allonocardiopsis opalescens]